MKTRTIKIPKDFAVQPLKPGQEAKDKATCGNCGLSWDDAIPTSWTPAPSARCPFEYFHISEQAQEKPKRVWIQTPDGGKWISEKALAKRSFTGPPTHTPTPWKVSQTGKFVMHSKPGTVLNVCEASIEDAAFIVRAVNAHDELVDQLLFLRDSLEMDEHGHYTGHITVESLKEVERVIAKATGGK